NRTTTHARQTTPLRTSNLHHAIALSPNARLILRHKRHALTQTRSSLRSHNINTATIRQTDELLTRPNDHITQRTLINHRPQRAVSIIRLILSRRRNLNERSRPRTPHRVPSLILKHPPAPTPMIRTPVRLTANSPPRKQDRPHSLSTHKRRNQRRLAPLLRPHKLRPPKHKRISLLPQTSIITHR